MAKTSLEEIEEALEFGIQIGRISYCLGGVAKTLNSTLWDDGLKKKSIQRLNQYREFAQMIVETVDKKYSGIKVAEDAKDYAKRELFEIEKAALPYLE